jgi:pyruvate/2-oxoglutarate dehydrogenase complex dihydrolipoamide dehydrogenase (E3) component
MYHVAMDLPTRIDVAVIGGGAAGLSAAQTAAAAGRRTLLVEKGRLGGECTWNGCVPSKALIEAARLRHAIGRAARFGIAAGDVSVDFAAVMRHVRGVVGAIASYEDADHVRRAGIEVVSGRARIIAPTTLEIDGRRLDAARIIVCAGSHPAVPPIPGLEAVPFLTNETLFELTEQPGRLAVVGAGPIGLEMAQAFTRLGTSVTVLDAVETFLSREDPEIAACAHGLLTAEGIRFRLGVDIAGVARDGSSVVLETRSGEGAADRIAVDAVLVATGRRPAVTDLGLEAAGVEVGPGGVAVDAHMRTAVHSIYAAGDVTGIMPFTHAAAYQGRIAAQHALHGRATADHRVVPWITFTDPEIAHVGLTEPEARDRYGDVQVATLPYTAVDRAVIQREVHGLLKVVTRGKPVLGQRGGGEVIGAHIVGPSAGELIHEFALAIQTRAFAGRLAQTIHAYPSMALGVQQVVAQLFPLGRATGGEMRSDLVDSL